MATSEVQEIQSFVFLDFEGSGLLGRKPRITELCLVALHRSALTEGAKNHLGRVMDELTLCVNPVKPIPDPVTNITGLDNYNLSCKKDFDLDTVTMLNCFLRRQQKPICLVAYNGKGYDFGLLKSELLCIGAELVSSVYCIDPLDFFRADDSIPPMYDWSPKKIPLGVRDPRTPERPGKQSSKNSRRELFPENPPPKRQMTEAKDVRKCQRILDILDEDENVAPGSPANSMNLDEVIELESSIHDEEQLSSLDMDSLEMFTHVFEEPGFSDEDDDLLCKALDDATEDEPHGVLFNKEAQKRPRSKTSHRMREVYFRAFGKYPAKEHFAKDDCYSLAQLFQKFSKRILPWCDVNGVQFQYVVPMYKPLKRRVIGEKIFER